MLCISLVMFFIGLQIYGPGSLNDFHQSVSPNLTNSIFVFRQENEENPAPEKHDKQDTDSIHVYKSISGDDDGEPVTYLIPVHIPDFKQIYAEYSREQFHSKLRKAQLLKDLEEQEDEL